MTIGNMHFDIEKNRDYTPEELSDIILAEPYGMMFMDILMNNNPEWYCLVFPCIAVKDNGKIFLHTPTYPHTENETDQVFEEIISAQPLCVTDEKAEELVRKKNRDKLKCMITRQGSTDEVYVSVVLCDDDVPEDREALARMQFVQFLNDTGINNTRKLRQAAREAIKLYQESIGADDNPFVLPF